MRNILISSLLLLFIMAVSCYHSDVMAQNDLRQLTSSMNQKLNSINTYHAKLNTTIYPSCIPANNLRSDQVEKKDESVYSVTVVMGEADKRMKINTFMHEKESNINIKHGLTYDGTWLWIEQKTEGSTINGNNKKSISAMKIRIAEVSPDPKKEPFNALFFVNGTGLWPYKDLPGTFKTILDSYVFNKISESNIDGELTLTGLRKEKIDSDEKEMSDLELFCHLNVRKKDYLITSISYGAKSDSICMNTDIEYVGINGKLPANVFTYNTPKDVPVRDITPFIKAKIEKNE